MNASYHATPGGAPVEFTVGPVHCTKLALGPMDNNAYLLATDDALVLIDAPTEASLIIEAIAGRTLDALITTHRHADHVQALAEVVAQAVPQTYAGEPDCASIESQTGIASTPLWTGDEVGFGAIRLQVIGLVGHTPGSIALVLDGGDGPTHIFTGDSLFPGGVGKTGSDADFASLLDDVTTQIFDRFGDDTVIHPGHGDATTLGAERPHLDQWRARGW